MNTPKHQLDWGLLAPLRFKAKALAEGVYAGTHRSVRRGAGVEFGGHRDYIAGDDLRFLDRSALLRHGKLLIRQFETETDRSLKLWLDATPSMAYRSDTGLGAKLAYAALLAGALGRIAIASGDPVSLDWIGGQGVHPMPALGGREAFERLSAILEDAEAGLGESGAQELSLKSIDLACARIARQARRGSVIVLFSDLLDLPERTLDRCVGLFGGGRLLIVVQVLDPAEVDFPFEGPVRLRSSEASVVVETEANEVRRRYHEALLQHQNAWSTALLGHGGRLVVANTKTDPLSSLRSIVRAIAGDPL